MDVKIITAPDIDYTNNFKILLVDFEWVNLEAYTHIFTESENDLVIYLLKDSTNIEWALNTANQANAILINCDKINNFEFLKGYLLSYKNAVAYGKNNQSLPAKETYYDIAVWFTKLCQKNNLIKPNWND